MKRAGSLDADKVREQLLKLETKTIFGEYKVDADGFQVAHKMVTFQWQGEKKVTVWPDDLARCREELREDHPYFVSGVVERTREKPNLIATRILTLEQGERELARSLAILRATLESTTDGILVTESTGKVAAFNSKFLRLWNLPSEFLSNANHGQVLQACSACFKNPRQFVDRVLQIEASEAINSLDELDGILAHIQ